MTDYDAPALGTLGRLGADGGRGRYPNAERVLLSIARGAQEPLPDGGAVLVAQPSREVPGRWIGHEIQADADLELDARVSLSQAHVIAHRAEQLLTDSVPKLSSAVVHAYPAAESTFSERTLRHDRPTSSVPPD